MSSTPESPAIVVDRSSALIDVPITIRLRGFPAGQPVTATLEFADASQWQSRATFTANVGGRVDLARQAPVSGTYNGVAAMGLFWSAEWLPSEWLPLPPGSGAGPGVTRQIIRTAGIVGVLFLPPGDGPHPAVIASRHAATPFRSGT